MQALTSNSGLQSLLLDTNALGDEGAAMLATVRPCPSLLTELCPLGLTMPCACICLCACSIKGHSGFAWVSSSCGLLPLASSARCFPACLA